MRIVIFSEDGNELVQGKIDDLTVNGETMHVDIHATICPSWHALPEGGQSASAAVSALIDHIVANSKATVKYSRFKYSSGPAGHLSPVASASSGAMYDMHNGR